MKRLPFYLGQVILVLIILWWRSHTFGPAIVDEIGFNLWPYAQTETEPLDCDESAYAYMGRRQAEGAVLYQDLTEYKPPLGYWYYALGMAIGGNHELTVRLMILPVLVVNLMLVGWILRQTANSWASILGQICFVVLSTDPYVYGNGSNFEHLMNLFLTAAIAALIKAGTSEHQPAGRTYLWLMLSGVSLGLAVCVKQVCIMAAIPLAVFILTQNSSFRKIVTGFLALGSGFLLPLTVSVVILALQGALTSAWQDVIVYSRTMASLTPPDVKAPSLAIRWITGNSDPRNGHLPWPFGKTDWLVWWGTGSWP
ncbi:MAG: hypothetical protein RJA81_6, partial [Planctomycetota bacterium]